MKMTVYLTSVNVTKLKAAKLLNKDIVCLGSDSGIEGGQPYGLKETKQGCINRTKGLENKNYISIENGFVRETDNIWYDIAFIHAKIDGKLYNSWSEKRYFPKELYNKTEELIKYFEKHSITRLEQLSKCVISLNE